jgi:hypothetical protein
MKTVPLLATLLALALLPAALHAQACCEYSMYERLALWDGDTGHNWRFRLRSTYFQADGFQSGDSRRTRPEAARRYSSLPAEMTQYRVEASAGYAFAERWAAFLTLPYVRNEMDMDMLHTMDMGMGMPPMNHWMRHEMPPVEGLGDATALLYWRVWQRGAVAILQQSLTLGLGLQLPTGEYDKRGANGRPLHAAMQAGTGAWDPLATIEYRYAHDKWEARIGAFADLTTPNPKGYEFGDSLTLAATAAYTPLPALTLRAGPSLRATARAHDRDGRYSNPMSLEDDTRNTGGTRLSALIGAEIRLPARLTLDLSASLPLWADLNGIQQRPAPLYAAALTYRL